MNSNIFNSIILSNEQVNYLMGGTAGINRLSCLYQLIQIVTRQIETSNEVGESTTALWEVNMSEVALSKLWKCDRKTVSKMLDHMNKSEEDMLRGKVHQEPATGALAIVNKGGSAVKNNIYTTLELNMYSPEDMLFMYQEKAKELQHYIDTNTMPEEVCDTAKFGMENGVPKRCMLYCDFRDVCPNYSKYKKLTDRKIAEGLNSNIEKEKYVYIKPMEF